jgi:putative transposase
MLAQKIKRLFNENRRTYGWRRIGRMLAREGIRCGKERILRLMKRQGLRPIQKRRGRPKTTQSRHDQPVAINRLKGLDQLSGRPNEVWCGDITYIPTLEQGWLYLAGQLDLNTKRLIGWKLGDSLESNLVIEAFRRAITLASYAPDPSFRSRGSICFERLPASVGTPWR